MKKLRAIGSSRFSPRYYSSGEVISFLHYFHHCPQLYNQVMNRYEQKITIWVVFQTVLGFWGVDFSVLPLREISKNRCKIKWSQIECCAQQQCLSNTHQTEDFLNYIRPTAFTQQEVKNFFLTKESETKWKMAIGSRHRTFWEMQFQEGMNMTFFLVISTNSKNITIGHTLLLLSDLVYLYMCVCI